MTSPRLLILFTFATVLVVGFVIALATGKWWVLLLALLAHATASVLVISAIGKRLSQGDKPDPLTEAKQAENAEEGKGGREDRELVI